MPRPSRSTISRRENGRKNQKLKNEIDKVESSISASESIRSLNDTIDYRDMIDENLVIIQETAETTSIGKRRPGRHCVESEASMTEGSSDENKHGPKPGKVRQFASASSSVPISGSPKHRKTNCVSSVIPMLPELRENSLNDANVLVDNDFGKVDWKKKFEEEHKRLEEANEKNEELLKKIEHLEKIVKTVAFLSKK